MELFIALALPVLLGILVAEFWLMVVIDGRRAGRRGLEASPGLELPPVPEPGTHEAALAEVPESIRHQFQFPWPLNLSGSRSSGREGS